MQMSKIKPIPKYMLKRIQKEDMKYLHYKQGTLRFYAYLTKNAGELVKVTVAVKYKKGNWHCKQVAVHGVHSKICFIKDIVFHMLGGYSVGWYAEGLQTHPKWYEDPRWDVADDKNFDPCAPVINPEYLSKFTEYKYSALERYQGVEYLKYLRTYEQYPQLEYLMKAGLSDFKYSKQILEKIGKDKRFCKWLLANRIEIQKKYHYVAVILRAYRTGQPLERLQKFEEWKHQFIHEKDLRDLRQEFTGQYEALFQYLDKQGIFPYVYQDYYRACRYLGLDMTEEKNRFPHDFNRWHDIRTNEFRTAKALKDKQEREKLYADFALIAEKYIGLQESKDGFAIVIARSPEDLIQEGKALHHCVGQMGYDQKFIKEQTLIFFVRNSTDPDTPFVTMEYSLQSKKILQCYADHNSHPDETVLNFVRKKWLPYANRKVRAMQKTA